MSINDNVLIEIISAAIHDQWIEWAKTILRDEKISEGRAKRWNEYMVPYSELPDDIKEYDRVYARMYLEIFKKHFNIN